MFLVCFLALSDSFFIPPQIHENTCMEMHEIHCKYANDLRAFKGLGKSHRQIQKTARATTVRQGEAQGSIQTDSTWPTLDYGPSQRFVENWISHCIFGTVISCVGKIVGGILMSPKGKENYQDWFLTIPRKWRDVNKIVVWSWMALECRTSRDVYHKNNVGSSPITSALKKNVICFVNFKFHDGALQEQTVQTQQLLCEIGQTEI